jgi:hypothetical protein
METEIQEGIDGEIPSVPSLSLFGGDEHGFKENSTSVPI